MFISKSKQAQASSNIERIQDLKKSMRLLALKKHFLQMALDVYQHSMQTESSPAAQQSAFFKNFSQVAGYKVCYEEFRALLNIATLPEGFTAIQLWNRNSKLIDEINEHSRNFEAASTEFFLLELQEKVSELEKNNAILDNQLSLQEFRSIKQKIVKNLNDKNFFPQDVINYIRQLHDIISASEQIKLQQWYKNTNIEHRIGSAEFSPKEIVQAAAAITYIYNNADNFPLHVKKRFDEAEEQGSFALNIYNQEPFSYAQNSYIKFVRTRDAYEAAASNDEIAQKRHQVLHKEMLIRLENLDSMELDITAGRIFGDSTIAFVLIPQEILKKFEEPVKINTQNNSLFLNQQTFLLPLIKGIFDQFLEVEIDFFMPLFNELQNKIVAKNKDASLSTYLTFLQKILSLEIIEIKEGEEPKTQNQIDSCHEILKIILAFKSLPQILLTQATYASAPQALIAFFKMIAYDKFVKEELLNPLIDAYKNQEVLTADAQVQQALSKMRAHIKNGRNTPNYWQYEEFAQAQLRNQTSYQSAYFHLITQNEGEIDNIIQSVLPAYNNQLSNLEPNTELFNAYIAYLFTKKNIEPFEKAWVKVHWDYIIQHESYYQAHEEEPINLPQWVVYHTVLLNYDNLVKNYNDLVSEWNEACSNLSKKNTKPEQTRLFGFNRFMMWWAPKTQAQAAPKNLQEIAVKIIIFYTAGSNLSLVKGYSGEKQTEILRLQRSAQKLKNNCMSQVQQHLKGNNFNQKFREAVGVNDNNARASLHNPVALMESVNNTSVSFPKR